MKSLAPSGVDLINTGVSTSIKFSESRYSLVSFINLCLSIILFLIGDLLRSRYLYFILNSSPPSVLSSIVKGGTSDSFNISKVLTLISISPVIILSFFDCLSETTPSTLITNSLPKVFAEI